MDLNLHSCRWARSAEVSFKVSIECLLWWGAVDTTEFCWCRRNRRSELRLGLENLSLIWAKYLGLTAFLCSLAWRENCCRGHKAKHPSELHLFYRKFKSCKSPSAPSSSRNKRVCVFCSRFVCVPVINASVFHSLGSNCGSGHWGTWQLKERSESILITVCLFSQNIILSLSSEIATGRVHNLLPT